MRSTAFRNIVFGFALVLGGCSQTSDSNAAAPAAGKTGALPFGLSPVATLNFPLAMTFLPDGRALVTEKSGQLRIVTQDGKVSDPLQGVPPVVSTDQGGLADVVLHPDFDSNGYVYLSYSEPGPGGTAGAAVGRGKFTETGLEGFQVIWRQEPKAQGNNHLAGKMVFSPDGFLFISSGDRHVADGPQSLRQNLGKIVRLTDTGGIPSDNPYYDEGRVKAQIWSLGHRNPLGIAFDREGSLWEVEMGPKGGDELNLILSTHNYGWPTVSNGNQYDGRLIPQHSSRPEFEAPKISWTPVISPSSMMIYSGDVFPEWKGNALIGGLSGQTVVRVALENGTAREVERFEMPSRIRDVAQAPDGSVWVLEDGYMSPGRLVKLIPHAGK